MNMQTMQTQDMDLVLSTDAKPRLKWTQVLHQRFVETVTQLGGADKATPKNLMRAMGVPGLTLYHLKSHLQKYRLGKKQQALVGNDKDEDGDSYKDNEIESCYLSRNQMHNDESLQISQALHMQMEVQEKLNKQIEVQRHLQLRIEAQGKYLQSILSKAQETLAGYGSSPTGVETAKSQVSELVSMLNGRGTMSYSPIGKGDMLLSITNGKGSMLHADCSLESSLTSSSESPGRKHQDMQKPETTSPVLQLMDTNPTSISTSYQLSGRKRSVSTISEESSVEQPLPKRASAHKEKVLSIEFDMNHKYQGGSNSGGVEQVELDLNCEVDESPKQFGA